MSMCSVVRADGLPSIEKWFSRSGFDLTPHCAMLCVCCGTVPG